MGIFRRIFGRTTAASGGRSLSPFKAGLIAVVVVGVAVFLAFSRVNPFLSPYELNAVFHTADTLEPDAPVRIAGVDVGIVKRIQPVAGEEAAMVTMEIQDHGLPIHEDAQLKIRPRIFLEGNEFVDVEPGTPSAPTLDSGGTIPVNQTATPVGLFEVLNVLDKNTREDFRTLFEEYALIGLNQGGARAFNRSIEFWADAYRNTALASDALLGTEEGDLFRVLRGQQGTFEALSRNPEALRDLVTNFNVTAAAFAREDDALEAAIPELRDVLEVGVPALESLNSSFPGIQRFAVEALPAARTSQVTVPESFPFVRQLRLLFRPSELRGLVDELRPTIPALVRLNFRTIPLLKQSRSLSRCTNDVLLPFSRTPIPNGEPAPGATAVNSPDDEPNVDPDFPDPDSTNQPFMEQGPRSFVGLAGESRTSDANGKFFRVNFRLDNAATVIRGPSSPSLGDMGPFVTLAEADEESRPAPPPQDGPQEYQRPHYRPDFPCELSAPPNLLAASTSTDASAPGASSSAESTDPPSASGGARDDSEVLQQQLERLRREIKGEPEPEVPAEEEGAGAQAAEPGPVESEDGTER